MCSGAEGRGRQTSRLRLGRCRSELLPLAADLHVLAQRRVIQRGLRRALRCARLQLRVPGYGSQRVHPLGARCQRLHRSDGHLLHEERHPLPPEALVDLAAVGQLLLVQALQGHVRDQREDVLALFQELGAVRRAPAALDGAVTDPLPGLLLPHGFQHLLKQLLITADGLRLVLFPAGRVVLLADLPVLDDDVLVPLRLPHAVADCPLLYGLARKLLEKDLLQFALLEELLLPLLLHENPPPPPLTLFPRDAPGAL
mmetsp:Transcript_1165/g.3615  ORF Transcript_1165/g.3615 Transcript_1165/m.3615 type:complete len:256 (-) Transcript_1165:1064-1831(-)